MNDDREVCCTLMEFRINILKVLAVGVLSFGLVLPFCPRQSRAAAPVAPPSVYEGEMALDLQDIKMDRSAMEGGVPVYSIADPGEIFGGDLEGTYNPGINLTGLDFEGLNSILSRKNFFRSITSQSMTALQASRSVKVSNVSANSTIIALKSLRIRAGLESSSINVEFPD